MKSNKAVQPFFIFLLPAIFLHAGCETQPADRNETSKPDSIQSASEEDIEWGTEVHLDEMVAMARRGRIKEIQWHVMPNILRAQASDGALFHLRNENKGVDLRNTLINSGVKIGKGGVLFRHVF